LPIITLLEADRSEHSVVTSFKTSNMIIAKVLFVE
jgi:hypothetical protein